MKFKLVKFKLKMSQVTDLIELVTPYLDWEVKVSTEEKVKKDILITKLDFNLNKHYDFAMKINNYFKDYLWLSGNSDIRAVNLIMGCKQDVIRIPIEKDFDPLKFTGQVRIKLQVVNENSRIYLRASFEDFEDIDRVYNN